MQFNAFKTLKIISNSLLLWATALLWVNDKY